MNLNLITFARLKGVQPLMAYKYAEKNKGKRSENMAERQIAEKEIK